MEAALRCLRAEGRPDEHVSGAVLALGRGGAAAARPGRTVLGGAAAALAGHDPKEWRGRIPADVVAAERANKWPSDLVGEMRRYLDIARGSLLEVESAIEIARELEYVNVDRYDELMRLAQKLDFLPQQVVLQVLVAEVDLTNTDEFGVEVGLQSPVLFSRSVIPAQNVAGSITSAAIVAPDALKSA